MNVPQTLTGSDIVWASPGELFGSRSPICGRSSTCNLSGAVSPPGNVADSSIDSGEHRRRLESAPTPRLIAGVVAKLGRYLAVGCICDFYAGDARQIFSGDLDPRALAALDAAWR